MNCNGVVPLSFVTQGGRTSCWLGQHAVWAALGRGEGKGERENTVQPTEGTNLRGFPAQGRLHGADLRNGCWLGTKEACFLPILRC
jgi:hypothetical protein